MKYKLQIERMVIFIMMIKITEACSMGCKHCMNDAKPNGKHMSIDTFKDVLEFIKKYNIGRNIIITGGEPLEHNNLAEIIRELLEFDFSNNKYFTSITITTNGEKILEEPNRFINYRKLFENRIYYQISTDVRYYPRRIDVNNDVFKLAGFILCDDCVQQIYPQGRAKTNNIPYKAKASKCYNYRSISHQKPEYDLYMLEKTMELHGKFCAPHISVDGDIKLGESDLCPVCSNIYKSEKEIIDDIHNFKCNGCDFINDKLPKLYKQFL